MIIIAREGDIDPEPATKKQLIIGSDSKEQLGDSKQQLGDFVRLMIWT